MQAVFATDLSEASEAAIRSRTCLECLARIGIDEIHLITVTSSNVHYGMPGVGDQHEKALTNQQRVFEAEGFTVETHVVRGTPHRRINGLAEQIDADLIIVGSRGQSPLERRFIGSTARNVARTAVKPVLLERIETTDGDHEVVKEHLFQRVLYATDFSENAAHAFEQFSVLQNATQEATLLHVHGPEQRQDEIPPEAARDRLGELATDLDGMDIETHVSVREGEPVQEILAEEAEVNPTVILLGARGLSRLRRLLIGSVSEKVAARATGNVLIVPPSRLR